MIIIYKIWSLSFPHFAIVSAVQRLPKLLIITFKLCPMDFKIPTGCPIYYVKVNLEILLIKEDVLNFDNLKF